MKYKVLRDFLWFKKGEIVETHKNGDDTYILNHRKNADSVWLRPDRYPNDFALISEKEEQIEEAKKLLIDNGYAIMSGKANEHPCTLDKPHSHLVLGKNFNWEEVKSECTKGR